MDLKNDTGYFLIQAGDFGSNHILNKGFYQHEGWQTTPRDSAHGEVKIGDVLLVYFTSTAMDHQKTLKMIYQVKSISKNNVRFYLEPKIELKGLSLDTVRNLIQNKQLSDIFKKIAQQGFNIAKISKVDFETVLKIDGNTLDVVVNSDNAMSPLLRFVKEEMTMKANYQPIVIKTILENGTDGAYTASIDQIKANIEQLNFGRTDFNVSQAFDTVMKALSKYVSSDNNVVSIIEKPKLDEIPKILKICGQKIAKWHIDEITKNEFVLWDIMPGSSEEDHPYLDEFLNTNSIGIGWEDTGDISNLSEEQMKQKFVEKYRIDKNEHGFLILSRFVKEIKLKDIIVLTKGQKEITDFGIVVGDYEYKDAVFPSYAHRKKVVWLKRGPILAKDLPDKLLAGFMATCGKIIEKREVMIDVLYREIIGVDLSEKELQNDTLGDLELSPFIEALKWKPNLILYGPPGTGKTYYANEIAKLITRNQNSNEIIADFKQQTWLGIAAKILLENNGTPINYNDFGKLASQFRDTDAQTPEETIARDIRDHIRKFGDQSIFSNPKEGVYGLHIPTTFVKAAEIILLARHEPMQYNEIAKVIVERNLVETKGETPERTLSTEFSRDRQAGENSTFIQIKPGTYALRNQITNITKKSSFIKMVTFHPSYSYEDFVEGFRPNVNDSSKQPYVLEDGIFKLICQSAKNDPDNWYVLLIDEINRGNIPKILGELITLIEKDKRNEKYALTLAYRKEDFFVPENLKIIATMNTADKSLMQMDDALKRRFVFEELMPDTTALLEHLKEKKVANAEDYKKILDRINEKILGKGEEEDEQKMKQFRDRQIGHSYFWEIKNDENLQSVIKYDIIPLLQDYFYGDYNEIRKILGTEIISGDSRPTNLVTDKSKANELKMELLKI